MSPAILSACFFLGLALCARASSNPNPFRVEKTDADLVQDALEQIPSWFSASDDESRDYILFRLFEVSKISTPDLRSGIVRFLSDVAELPVRRQAAERAKVALLSRLLFRVPDILAADQVDETRVSLVVGVGSNVRKEWPWYREAPDFQMKRWVYMIAPLQVNSDGRTLIVADMSMMTGESTLADSVLIAEFDYFASEFGRAELRRVFRDSERRFHYFTERAKNEFTRQP